MSPSNNKTVPPDESWNGHVLSLPSTVLTVSGSRGLETNRLSAFWLPRTNAFQTLVDSRTVSRSLQSKAKDRSQLSAQPQSTLCRFG